MDCFAYLGSVAQAAAKITGKQSVSSQPVIVVAGYDSRKTSYIRINKIGSCLDQVSSRCFNTPDRILDPGERAEPVRGVRQLRTGDARKEIFCPTGKSGNLM